MSESVILGIDLGTTNSLAAWMTPVGPNVVRDEAVGGLCINQHRLLYPAGHPDPAGTQCLLDI